MARKKTQAALLKLLPDDVLREAAECLKAMAHPVRLRIADILMQGDGRFTVGDIAEMCGLPPHQASEHLRFLKAHGLIDGERDGRVVLYRIVNPRLPGLLGCIASTCRI